jgi:hypothetical protein
MMASAEYRFTIKPLTMNSAVGVLNDGHPEINVAKTATAAALSTISSERIIPSRAFLLGSSAESGAQDFESVMTRYAADMSVSTERNLFNVFRSLDRECGATSTTTVLCVEVERKERGSKSRSPGYHAVPHSEPNWSRALVVTSDSRIHSFDSFIGRNVGRVTTDYIQDINRAKADLSIIAGIFTAHVRRDEVGIRMAVRRFDQPIAADLNDFRRAVLEVIEHLDIAPQKFVVTCKESSPEPLLVVLRENYKDAEIRLRHIHGNRSNLCLLLDKDVGGDETVFVNFSGDTSIEAIWIPSVKS